MAKPTVLPRWAELEDGTPAANIGEPPSGLKDTGYPVDAIPTSPVINWILRTLYAWAKYLDETTTFPGWSPFTDPEAGWDFPVPGVSTGPKGWRDSTGLVRLRGTFERNTGAGSRITNNWPTDLRPVGIYMSFPVSYHVVGGQEVVATLYVQNNGVADVILPAGVTGANGDYVILHGITYDTTPV